MRSGATVAALVCVALETGGCGGDGGRTRVAQSSPVAAAAAAAKRRLALCGRLRATVTGHVDEPAATELSGLVLSRTQRGVLWTHNDSGDRPRVLAVAANGRLLADVTVTGAEHVDWEDIAAARGTLLLADIGDNLAQRPSVVVYRIVEPPVVRGSAWAALTASAPATRLVLRYPDGPRDAEALLRDPASGALVIVSKSFDGRAGVYVAARPVAGAPVTLRRSGAIALGVGEAVTAGDVSADGRTIALRTYDRAYFWRRRGGESVAAALRRRPCSAHADLLVEGQGEALALSRDGRAFYTVPEGLRPPIRSYAPI